MHPPQKIKPKCNCNIVATGANDEHTCLTCGGFC